LLFALCSLLFAFVFICDPPAGLLVADLPQPGFWGRGRLPYALSCCHLPYLLGATWQGEVKNRNTPPKTRESKKKKSTSKSFFKEIDKKVNASFPSVFFFFRVLSVLQRWEFKNNTKKRLTKKIVSVVSKVFANKSSILLFYHVFGRLSARVV
jgi:hypothetical protein